MIIGTVGAALNRFHLRATMRFASPNIASRKLPAFS
jgi:hypothetical protein